MGIPQQLQVGHASGLTYQQVFLLNDDLVPVSPEKRTWRSINFLSFWIADSFNVNTWMIVASMIQLGLSWWQAWICVWIGYGLVAPFIVLNARPGAVIHVTFPVVARTSFGIYGSLWCTFNRGVMACIWYGVQASIGGECVKVNLRALWQGINDIPNTLPESSGTTTRDFLCFFLFWLISLPAIWFPIHQIRHLFTLKSIVTPIAGITFCIWCIVKANGVGPIVSRPPTVHGSELRWSIVVIRIVEERSIYFLVRRNAPDFASRARTPSAAVWPQLIGFPLSFGLVSFVGIIVSSSSETIYGEVVWSPIDLLGRFLDNNPSKATRFRVWFISFAFIIAQLGTNISANSISAGCDLSALCPRFINIRRGGYVSAVVGICILPWNLLKSSNGFTSYLSAYAVFLSSIAGVMITEYYFIRRGHYRVADLYDTKDSWYWYTWGINFRAYAAYIAGILINVIGFTGTTGRTVPIAATRIYQISFFTGFGVSAVVYYLNTLFPVPGVKKTFEEVDLSNYPVVTHEMHDIFGSEVAREKIS